MSVDDNSGYSLSTSPPDQSELPTTAGPTPTDHPLRPTLSSTSRPLSAIFLGDHSDPHNNAGRKGPPHDLIMATGFASVKVGLGSPKLEFGRRDWVGGYHPHSGSDDSEHPGVPENEHPDARSAGGDKEATRKGANGLVDRVSGLPSPPGTESDIVIPPAIREKPRPADQSATSQRPAPPIHRTSSTNSSNLLSHSSSPSGSTTSRTLDPSPRRRTPGLKPKHSPSMSRSSSSSSVAFTSPLNGDKRPPLSNGSSRRHSTDLMRISTHSRSSSHGSQRRGTPSLELGRSPHSRVPSPEKTARQNLPPVSSGLDKLESRRSSRRLSGGGSNHEDQERDPLPRRSSHGSELDERIREAEERILQASSGRVRRTVDVEEKATPVRGAIRRHDLYSRAKESPSVVPSSAIRRSATLSSALGNANGHTGSASDLPSKRGDGDHEMHEEDEDRERSGGSGSSRRRKGLPADFRHGGLFTPSPQKPYTNQTPNEDPSSSRSARLRQFIDSPTDYTSSSPIPNRFASTSRLSREIGQVSSPSRVGRQSIDGLERSSSMAATRHGETSAYARRTWTESISGLPRNSDDLDHRGLPRDRYPAESVMGAVENRDRTHARHSTDSALADRESTRRGISALVGGRDLASASGSRLASLAPGDSVSAVGARSDRVDSKDPLEMVRRLEEQRAQAKERWNHMPRPATSMSSIRDVYNHPPRSAPLDGIRPRRSMDHDNTPISPLTGRGASSRLGLRGPATEPRPMRSSTSLGGRSTANLDFPSASSEHGRLLFEAFRALDSRLGQDVLLTQPELIRTFHSATRTSETINTSVRSAVELASQIAIYAEMSDDPSKMQEEYSRLAFLLRDAARASDQNVRDMTRIMLDLPKLFNKQASGSGSGMTASPSVGSSSRLRRSESNVGQHTEAARRWQPTSPDATKSPLQGRWSMDSPRRRFDVLRPSTSVGESYSPLSSRDQRRGPGSSTVSSLMSKVRAMTPRKQHTLSPKPDLSTIEQSPPQPQYNNDNSASQISLPAPAPVSAPAPRSNSSMSRGSSPEKPARRNVLKKKASTTSTHTIRGSSNFLPSTSRPKATTAISQVTAGDLNHPNSNGRGNGSPDRAMSVRSTRTFEDEPPSPMSRFSFNAQSQRNQRLQEEDESEDDEGEEGGGGEEEQYYSASGAGTGDSYETDAVSMLEQRLVSAAKAREESATHGKHEEEAGEGGQKRPSLGDRFRASLRKGVA
ncbi:hypothetical protein CI109_102257 [Kwoniella shandongensis]|uniref:Uncharacterized protein n=1 Tax=Kwoniella shandongensis TaxID=1734106 RepID=A0AAJ8LJC6_9TREE